MAYTYLLDIYQFLNQRLTAAKAQLTDYEKEDPLKHAIDGRINALLDIKAYLSRNFDVKLPRRIYKQLCLNQELFEDNEAHTTVVSREP